MVELITIEEAKAQCRVFANDDLFNVELRTMIRQASGVIMDHIKLTEAPDAWIVADTSPAILEPPWAIHCVACLMVGTLFANREASTTDLLTPVIWKMLDPYRIPTMA